MIAADKVKLNGIATGATNYVHPANHSPSVINQDTNNRFVTDAEKSTWNGKANASHTHTKANITDMSSNVSQFTNDAGYITSSGSGARIATNVTAPATPSSGDFWYKIL